MFSMWRTGTSVGQIRRGPLQRRPQPGQPLLHRRRQDLRPLPFVEGAKKDAEDLGEFLEETPEALRDLGWA